MMRSQTEHRKNIQNELNGGKTIWNFDTWIWSIDKNEWKTTAVKTIQNNFLQPIFVNEIKLCKNIE